MDEKSVALPRAGTKKEQEAFQRSAKVLFPGTRDLPGDWHPPFQISDARCGLAGAGATAVARTRGPRLGQNWAPRERTYKLS